ncbi:MAG TPA: AMP-binding protein [Dehalococcoidia bacterium]|nr:AMP-binding protein [Dehalococcoidia bacterium]
MVFKSPWPSLEPYAPISVPALIEATVRRLPDKTALMTAEGTRYTFAEFWAAVRGTARALQQQGIAKGDMVGIYAPNSVEYAVALHGALLAGATVTTLNPLYREREVEHQLQDAGAKIVFTLSQLRGVVDEAKAHVPTLQQVIELEGVWEMAAAAAGDPSPVAIDPLRDIAVLPYSSGTTGLPKGVMLSHQNLTANVRQTIALGMTLESAVVLDFLPFYHIYGMMVLLNTGLATGATQIILPRFDPEAALGVIQEHRVTDLYCVPPAVLALVHQPRLGEFDLTSLRFLMSGAAPLPGEVARQAAAKLGCVVMEGYGMTESSPITNVNPLASPRAGTVGPPVADTLEKIVSLETGEELAAGEIGELLVFGPQVMLGYWNKPDATRETMTADGWLRTGDIASADADGYVRIHDRKKEMIKYKGYQVAPAELEALLMEHPGVRDAAVIPKADEEAGEVPKAFVVAREAGLDLQDVLAFVAGKVAPYKKIRDIEMVEAIPKNPSGKILRRQLIEQERAKAAER